MQRMWAAIRSSDEFRFYRWLFRTHALVILGILLYAAVEKLAMINGCWSP